MQFTRSYGGDGCLQGYMDTSYEKLVEVFGEPDEGDGYKTRAEWVIEFEDGIMGTIYDWKRSEPLNEVKTWNVGGHDPRPVMRFSRLVDAEKIHFYTYPNGLKF